MKIAFNPSTVEALITPPNNKDITFDLRGHNIFARGVKFCGTDTWRPVVDNLTSDSTTSSLSANLGRILKALIDGKSDSGHNHDDRYLKLTGGTISGRLLVNSNSNSYTTPSIAINYYDSYTVNDYSITQIKMGNPKYDMYLGLSPTVKGYYGKIGYFMHANTDCEFLWGTSGWTKRMALECSSGNLWVSGSITASSFIGNASTATNADTVDGEHASNFSYTHQSSFDFSKIKSGRIVTFDQSDTDYGWINGFASTHNNYLTSVIFNTHRTSNWYVGYIEGSYATGLTNGLLAVHKLAFVDLIPTSLKNPHALTISLNGTSQGPYDGSAAKNINITPGSIGAATSDHNHDGRYVYNYGDTANVNGLALNQNALFMSTNSGITEDWWHILQAAWNNEYRWNSLIAFPTLNRNGMYYRSGLDDNTKWGSWVKLLDIGNSYVTEGKGVINGTTITQVDNADKVDGYHASSLWRSDGGIWNPGANISLTASENNQEWSFDIRRNGHTGCYWHVWDSDRSTMLKVNADNGKVYAPYNFVGNLEGNASTATNTQNIRIDQYASTGEYPIIWADSASSNANSNTISRLYKTWKYLYWTPNKKTLTLAGNGTKCAIGSAFDGNDRPGLHITGNYPELIMMSLNVSNTNHGSTIVLGAYTSNSDSETNYRAFAIGMNGPTTNEAFLDFGYGVNLANPHANGIANYGGGSFNNPYIMRLTASKRVFIQGIGDDLKPALLVNTYRNGGWVYTASFLAPNLTSNNNNAIFIGKAHSACNAFGLTHMHIGDGSVNNYAALEVWGVGNVLRWYYDRHSSFLHRADFSSLGSDASYMNSALLIREHGYNGTQADTWANAPRMSWHWSGRVQTQIGLGSNNELYLSKNDFGNAYRLVYETGTWGINITGNASSASNSDMLDGYHASAFVKMKLFRFNQYNQGTWTKILTITINSTNDLLPAIAFSWIPSECSRTIWADFSINWRSNSPIFYAIWKGMDSRTLKVVNSSGAIWDVWVSGSKTDWDPFGEIQVTYTHNITSYNGGSLGYSDIDPGGTICITGGQVNYATSANICSYPAGFTSRGTSDWSGVPGTLATDWSVNGADIMFKYDSSKLNVITDGRFYQGIDIYGASKRVLDEYDINHTTWGYASNSDMVDGYHASDFASSSHSHNYAANENYGGFTKSGRLPISGFYQSNESESGDNAPWSSWMHLINCLHSNTNNNYALLIAASFYDNNTFKIRVTNDNVNNDWRDIIHSGNIGSQTVASATKLQTPRNIWGQSFDGTADVNGTIYINNSDSSNGAIRLNNNVNSNARISAIDDKVIFNTGNAIRFGETSWDWNQWAGLKYTHSNKTIYLGIADGSVFNANNSQSNGTLRLAGITTVTPDSGARIGGSGGDLYLGNADNSSWLKVQNMCSQESSNWAIKQNGEAYFDKTLEARGIIYTKPYSNSLGINFLNWDSSIAANVTNMFNGIPYDNISIEYSRDNGASWTTYTSDPSLRFNLVNDNTPKTDFMLGNASTDNRNQLKQNQLRVTIKIPNEIYQELSWISVEVNKDVFIKCQVYLGDSNGNYSESTNKIIKGNSHLCDICVGPLGIKVGNNTHRYVRLVFSHTSITLLRNGIVSKIRGLALTKYKKPGDRYNISTTGHIYDYDYNMAATFPNSITAHGLVRANGFYHSSVNSNDYMLLAGGGYSQGVPVRYWAIYYIGIGNNGAVICTKRSGNYNFITSEVWESLGIAIFDISFPSGYNKNNTLIFGNGDHIYSSYWKDPVYVTITTSTDFSTEPKIRVVISNDKDPSTGFANIYFMCMG